MHHWYLLFVQVDDEILLAFELPGQLSCGDVFERALLRLLDLVGLILVLIRHFMLTRRQSFLK